MNGQVRDVVFDKLDEQSTRDMEIMDQTIYDIVESIKNRLVNKEDDFSLRHAYKTLSKVLVLLTQGLCESEEHFHKEIAIAQNVAIDKIVTSIFPKQDENGNILEEDFDMENLSVRRVMLALGTAIDYVIWRQDLANYSNMRNELEQEQQQ